jgi:hypothetical protein
LLRFARNDAILLLLLALAAPALADEAPALNPEEQASLQSFAAAHPECVEWSDGCAVCRRAMAVSFSTPGIACQPAEIVCRAP